MINRIIIIKTDIGESLLNPIIVHKRIGKDKSEKINIFIEILTEIFFKIK